MIDLSNILPGWRAVEKIGEGSYGRVYRCVNDNAFGISDECAVKIISIPMSNNEIREVWAENPSEHAFKMHFREIVENFANEIKLMLTLNGSPNVVTIRSYKIIERQNQIGWDIYICMDFLTPFAKYSRQKNFNDEEIRKFGIDICSALEVCAKYGIIHRDIKPDNIFIDKFGNYRLGDFGVAKQLENSTASMTRIGTMRYMAPEVYDGRKYDARADIYSLGMVMYKLLNNGRDPLTDPYKEYLTDKEVASASEMRRRGAQLPPPCNASRELARIILKACEFNPDYRYSSANEFRRDLERFVAENSENTETQIAPDLRKMFNPEYATVDQSTVAPRSVLTSAPAMTVRQPYAPPAAQQVQMPVQMQTPVQQQEKPKSGKGAVIAAVLLSLLAVVAVVVCAVLFINKDNQKSDEEDKTKNEQGFVFQEDAPEIEIMTDDGYYFEPDESGESATQSAQADGNVYAGYYNDAVEAYNSGNYGLAAILFSKAQNYKNAEASAQTLWAYVAKSETVSAGYDHTVAVKKDGTVVATGSNQYGQCNVSGWSNVVSVSAGSGHTVALKADGTVVAAGWNKDDQCNVSGWRDIVAVSAGGNHTVGLKADGTVVATGFSKHDRCNTGSWSNVVAISAGSDHTVALKADGTVVATGYSENEQCDVGEWTNIKAIATGTEHTVGLKADGTVLVAGDNRHGECDVEGWSNVRMILAKDFHTIAITNDGKILTTGLNDLGQNDIGNLSFVGISTGWSHTAVLHADGTVTAIGDNAQGQCGTDDWSDIRTK